MAPLAARIAGLLTALVLVAAACGDTSGPSLDGEPQLPAVTPATEPAAPTDPAAPTATGAPAAAAISDLPDVTVVDLAGGEFHLPDLAPSDRPILLWFWAPH